MKKTITLFVLLCFMFITPCLAVQAPVNPIVAPGTISATSATIVWDKPEIYRDIVRYRIFLNGKEVAYTDKCNYLFKDLKPETAYRCVIKAEEKDGSVSASSVSVLFKTTFTGKTINITTFGAVGDGKTLNTKAIQKAIDACPTGGTVLIPQGTFVSGALFLKSRMTLRVEKGATLQGSLDENDYLPYINNRFEGWEMKTYASLINAGVMNHNGGYVVDRLSIRGEGTISGGGSTLGKAMIAKGGMALARGGCFCLMNCSNVEIQGLQIVNSPCWTIHYIYSKGVSCHDLNIVSTAHNGDGLDPDSSDDSYIFNCQFSTGDDCIAIKSGKNPEGSALAKPTNNVRITDCIFTRGHGISIGSEMSGGVSNVLVRDCKAGSLLHGMQIKGTKERGGYVRNVTVADCQLLQITVFSAVNYNNDGEAAADVPIFENYTFRNIDLSAASGKEPVMDINGFKAPGHQLKNVTFTDILLPEKAKIVMKDAMQVKIYKRKNQLRVQQRNLN